MKPWTPHPGPQTDFLLSQADELFYGGAAGGGKSDALLAEAARDVDNPGFHALLLRRTYPELEGKGSGLIPRSQRLWRTLDGRYDRQKQLWTFPSGATVGFGHLEHADSVFAYHSAQFAYIGFDELTTFLESQYLYLLSRLRSPAGIRPRVRAAGNPGGIGHTWVRRRFVEKLRPGELRWFKRAGAAVQPSASPASAPGAAARGGDVPGGEVGWGEAVSSGDLAAVPPKPSAPRTVILPGETQPRTVIDRRGSPLSPSILAWLADKRARGLLPAAEGQSSRAPASPGFDPAATGNLSAAEEREEGADIETTAGDPDGMSRQFIPARVFDNPSLLEKDPGYLRRLKALDPIDRRRLLDGDWWAQNTGAVYREFNDQNITHEEPAHGAPIELAFDDGYVDPRVFLFIERRGDRILIADELFHSNHLGSQCIAELLERCRARGWARPVIAVGSPEAVELRELMRRANIPARGMATPIMEGIGAVRRLIHDANGYRALRVHRRCTRLLAELQGGYQYAPGNATHDHEQPLDRDNHGADALRYWVWMRARRQVSHQP